MYADMINAEKSITQRTADDQYETEDDDYEESLVEFAREIAAEPQQKSDADLPIAQAIMIPSDMQLEKGQNSISAFNYEIKGLDQISEAASAFSVLASNHRKYLEVQREEIKIKSELDEKMLVHEKRKFEYEERKLKLIDELEERKLERAIKYAKIDAEKIQRGQGSHVPKEKFEKSKRKFDAKHSSQPESADVVKGSLSKDLILGDKDELVSVEYIIEENHLLEVLDKDKRSKIIKQVCRSVAMENKKRKWFEAFKIDKTNYYKTECEERLLDVVKQTLTKILDN